MKKKIIAVLKPKVTSKGFSQKTIDGLADILVGQLEEDASDDDISSAIEGIMPYAELMQAENTRYANSIKSKTQPTPKGGEEQNDDPENPAAPTVTAGNTELDKLTQIITGLATTVNGLVTANKQQTLQQKWDEAVKGKGITNQTLIQKWMPADESAIEDSLNELVDFNKQYVKTTSNADTTGYPPAGGGDVEGANKADGKKALEQWSKSNAPVETTTKTQ